MSFIYLVTYTYRSERCTKTVQADNTDEAVEVFNSWVKRAYEGRFDYMHVNILYLENLGVLANSEFY